MPQINPVVASHIANVHLLQGLCRQVLSGDVPPEALTHQVCPEGSHILWLMGHIAWAIDAVMAPPISGRSESNGHGPLFGLGSTPVAVATEYPPVADLRAAIDAACEGLAKALKTQTDETLEQPLPPESPLAGLLPSIGSLVGFTLYHTGYHLGQISLLRRAQGLPSGVGM